jgi:hypothetical protein
MRPLFLTLIFLLNFIEVYSQLRVDAGNDTTYCLDWPRKNMYLAPNIRVENAVGPYSIRWEFEITWFKSHIFTASDFLNDTTILSPLIKEPVSWPDWYQFMVHVTDSVNNYAKDSINIRFSNFNYLLSYSVIQLKKGDSILLNGSNVFGGIPPLKYYYTPKTGLSNPDSSKTWCKPDSSIRYYSVAIDSCGCVSMLDLVYDIRMMTTGILESDFNSNNSLNITQQGKMVYFDNPNRQEARITLYSINGGQMSNFITTDDNWDFAGILKEKGIYIVNVSIGKFSGSRKFINY